MKLKLTDFKTPTGVTGNLLNFGQLWQLILGSMVLLLTFAMGQNILGKLSGRVPFVDTQIEQPWNSPQSAQPRKEVI